MLLIYARKRMYNCDKWLMFLNKCEENNIPLELEIYHEDMNNCMVRVPQNMVSRYIYTVSLNIRSSITDTKLSRQFKLHKSL